MARQGRDVVEGNAADGDDGNAVDSRLLRESAELRHADDWIRILFRRRREDGAERDVVEAERERALELFGVVRREAEAELGKMRAQRVGRQIGLPHVHAVAPGDASQIGAIVGEEPRLFRHERAQLRQRVHGAPIRPTLGAQLEDARARLEHPARDGEEIEAASFERVGVDDGVKTGLHDAVRIASKALFGATRPLVYGSSRMGQPNFFRFSRSNASSRGLWLTLAAAGVLATLACAPRKNQAPPPGVSVIEPNQSDDAPPTEEELAKAKTTTTSPPAPEAAAPVDPEVLRAQREEQLGRAALANASADPALGLAVALVDRAADLPWILAFENRGSSAVELAADPKLVRFEVLPPEPPAPPAVDATETAAATTTKKKPVVAAPKPPVAVVCGAKELPKTVSAESRLRIEPGQVLTYSFDPRPLCDDPLVLQKDARVTLTYGFPLAKKKVWSGGKMSEVEAAPAAPYVATSSASSAPTATSSSSTTSTSSATSSSTSTSSATSSSSTESTASSVKVLAPPAFVLGETYPLDRVEPLAPATTADAAGKGSETSPTDPAIEGAGSEDGARSAERPVPPPPPLTLDVKPLGTTSEVDETTVTVTVTNRTRESMRLFLRRELIVYEVLGPTGALTCRMHPAMRAPDGASFDQLGAGSSRSLTTRVAEACPPNTFAAPGTYAVSARLEARERGEEYGYKAFVGNARSGLPARFVITGSSTSRRPLFRLSPRPPATTPSATTPSATSGDGSAAAPASAPSDASAPAAPASAPAAAPAAE